MIQFGSLLKLNFRVHRRTATSKIFDMIVCSRNNAPKADICTNYEIDTSGSTKGNSVQVVKRANITLVNSKCATNIIVRLNYIVVSCPRWGNF